MPYIEDLKNQNEGSIPEFAWPGGYPMYYITSDGGVLSPKAVVENESLCSDPDDPQWHIIGHQINWEDENLTCDHTGDRIPSAYGEDE
jgi:hypothetical protein